MIHSQRMKLEKRAIGIVQLGISMERDQYSFASIIEVLYGRIFGIYSVFQTDNR